MGWDGWCFHGTSIHGGPCQDDQLSPEQYIWKERKRDGVLSTESREDVYGGTKRYSHQSAYFTCCARRWFAKEHTIILGLQEGHRYTWTSSTYISVTDHLCPARRPHPPRNAKSTSDVPPPPWVPIDHPQVSEDAREVSLPHLQPKPYHPPPSRPARHHHPVQVSAADVQ